MGLRINVGRAGTGPIIDIDSRLNAGSLLLLDPSHGSSSWDDGVPAAGALLPNLAAAQARAIVGADKEVRSKLLLGPNPGVAYKLERTPKGGLHGVVSQAGGHANGQGARIDIAQAILDFITANPTHRLFTSLWVNRTRTSGTITASAQPFIAGVGTSGSTAASVYHSALRGDITRPNGSTSPAATGLLPSSGAGSDALGVARRNVGSGGLVGTLASALLGSAMQWGSFGITPSSSTPAAQHPSHVFYGFHLVDLTVAGLSYAEADAADLDMFTRKISNPGGAYNGDTFTSPATFLP